MSNSWNFYKKLTSSMMKSNVLITDSLITLTFTESNQNVMLFSYFLHEIKRITNKVGIT